MTTTDMLQGNQDRQTPRRRPFSNWVKKLTNFKNSDGDRNKRHPKPRRGGKLNNPYPESGTVSQNHGIRHRYSDYSFATHQTGDDSIGSHSGRYSADDLAPPPATRSMAGTVSTDNETARSITAPSHGASSVTGTSRTIGGGLESRRGGDSTFSSPAPSVRSLTTTLTTIQSLNPNNNTQPTQSSGNNNGATGQSIHFSQPFSTASPASAIPAHLAPPNNPTTYSTATANNLLTDNASILTLASSSKRRRRRSMDTDASVRALAPSSLWGGSRESLPLSVLSSNVDNVVPGVHASGPRLGAERNSIYSTTGTGTAMPSDRTSVYTKQGDGASVRSGRLGHGRPDSISGGIGIPGTPLASPMEVDNDGFVNTKPE